jgi:hypothetical protein
MRALFPILGLVILALGLVTSFGLDLSRTMEDGAVDFRNRITGSRLLQHGIDPYHYIWHSGDPQQFCDTRNNPRMTVSKTTVTPAMLVFYAPLSALPYRTAQFIWLVAQWALLLGTAAWWLRATEGLLPKWLVAFFVLGFTFTSGWRWEAERGQCYTLLVFLAAIWLASLRSGVRVNAFVAGAVVGLLVALRPPWALLLPFLFVHRRGQFAGAAAGLLAGLVLPMVLHPAVWIDYAAAMHVNSDYYRHASLPPRPAQNFPPVIEGVPLAIMARLANLPFVDVTVYALAGRLNFGKLPDGPPLLIFAGLFVAWLAWTRREHAEQLVPGLAAWLFFSDFFLPAPRYAYYDVMFLNVALAVIACARTFPWPVLPALLAVPVQWTMLAMTKAPMTWLYVAQALFALTALLALFRLGMKSTPEPERRPD